MPAAQRSLSYRAVWELGVQLQAVWYLKETSLLLPLLLLQVYTKLNNMQACTQMLKTFTERYPGNVMRVRGYAHCLGAPWPPCLLLQRVCSCGIGPVHVVAA